MRREASYKLVELAFIHADTSVIIVTVKDLIVARLYYPFRLTSIQFALNAFWRTRLPTGAKRYAIVRQTFRNSQRGSLKSNLERDFEL
jgi:hypothetical protein